jgi:aminoglycoside 2''-phosphotransferase
MELSLEEIRRGLEAEYPELDLSAVRPLATGFGSVAVETPDRIVFRIPRWHGPANGQETEFRALPFLAGHLPAPIPDPRWRIQQGHPVFRLGAIGYPKIAGQAPEPGQINGDALAGDVATFFDALHRVPVAEAEEAGISTWLPALEGYQWQRDAVLPPLRELLDPAEYRVVARWWDALVADRTMVAFEPAVRHGDPWYGNVLVDSTTGRLTGVLDWEGVEIGDPAWDFAAQLDLGEAFFRSVISRCSGRDARLEHRARAIFRVREFGGVRHAAQLGDEAELADAVTKLRKSSILADH